MLSDCLILVDPTCPQASLAAMRSEVYQFLLSCCLCRDLYMFSPKMTFATHAHALLGAVTQYQHAACGEEFLHLGIKIVYSIRKFWGNFENAENKSLLIHWFEEWGGITQSSIDQCSHPVQLLLLLASIEPDVSSTNDDESDNKIVPLINLLNEVLARKAKLWMLAKDPENPTKAATKLLQRLFDITRDNSPKPLDDVLSNEPSIDFIRETCQNYATFNNVMFEDDFKVSFENKMERIVRPYFMTFQFALLLREQWSLNLQDNMERIGQVPPTVLKTLHAKMQLFKKADIVNSQTQVVMFVQAFMHHDNASRAGIVDNDVQHPATLQDLIVNLRLVHYLTACKVKQSEYQKIIGNVCIEEGLRVGTEQFSSLLGHHSHGLGKQQF